MQGFANDVQPLFNQKHYEDKTFNVQTGKLYVFGGTHSEFDACNMKSEKNFCGTEMWCGRLAKLIFCTS